MSPLRVGQRFRLTDADVAFLVTTLALNPADRAALTSLISDPELLDRFLDDERVYRAVLESPESLSISPQLYFYVIIRQAFREAGLEDRELADYVAAVLTRFAEKRKAGGPLGGDEAELLYGVDFLLKIEQTTPYQRYFLYASAGDQFLFLTGLFAGFLERRSHRRGAPGPAWYEQLGRRAYLSARDHPLATEFAMQPVYDILAQTFPRTRQILNGLSTRVLALD